MSGRVLTQKALAYRRRWISDGLPFLVEDGFDYPAGTVISSGDNTTGGVWDTTSTEILTSGNSSVYCENINIRDMDLVASLPVDTSRPYSYEFDFTYLNSVQTGIRTGSNGAAPKAGIGNDNRFHVRTVYLADGTLFFCSLRQSTTVLLDLLPFVNAAPGGSGTLRVGVRFPNGSDGGGDTADILVDGNVEATGVSKFNLTATGSTYSLLLERVQSDPVGLFPNIGYVNLRGYAP